MSPRVTDEALAVNTKHYEELERWCAENGTKPGYQADLHLDLRDARAEIAALKAEREGTRDLIARLIQEAQIWSHEARAHKSTVHIRRAAAVIRQASAADTSGEASRT